MRRACRPTCESPISPSISAFGTSAATESMTTMSTAPERTRISQISSACSPVSGCDTRRFCTSTPSFLAYSMSSACSASMNAATPPVFCALATTWRHSVVLPLDSGPKISVTRPRGIPPTPMAASRLMAPVGIASTRTRAESAPIFMIDPLPQLFSICAMARFSAFFRSSCTAVTPILHSLWCVVGLWPRGNLDGGRKRSIPRRNSEQTTEQTTKLQPEISGALVDEKRVFHMPHPDPVAAHQHSDDVEPVDLANPAVAVDPGEGGAHQLVPLLPVDRLHGVAKVGAHSGLHLDKRDQFVPLGDEVDIAVT